MRMQRGRGQASCSGPCCMVTYMMHVHDHVQAVCPCPCGMSQYMLRFHVHDDGMTERRFSSASSVDRLLTILRPASTFRHHGQSGTTGHGLVC